MDVPFEPVRHAWLRNGPERRVPAPSDASFFGEARPSTEVAEVAGHGTRGV